MNEDELKEQYNEVLDEMYPLEGIACNPFSILLEKGDLVAYNEGFNNYCDAIERDT